MSQRDNGDVTPDGHPDGEVLLAALKAVLAEQQVTRQLLQEVLQRLPPMHPSALPSEAAPELPDASSGSPRPLSVGALLQSMVEAEGIDRLPPPLAVSVPDEKPRVEAPPPEESPLVVSAEALEAGFRFLAFERSQVDEAGATAPFPNPEEAALFLAETFTAVRQSSRGATEADLFHRYMGWVDAFMADPTVPRVEKTPRALFERIPGFVGMDVPTEPRWEVRGVLALWQTLTSDTGTTSTTATPG